MINRRHDGRASCLARQRLKQLLPMEPRIDAPATGKGGHESVLIVKFYQSGPTLFVVTPAQAGAHASTARALETVDTGLRRYDDGGRDGSHAKLSISALGLTGIY